MNMIKKLAVAASVACGAAGIGASLVPGVASAGDTGDCPPGYRVIDTLPASGSGHGSGDEVVVYLTYNSQKGENCVVAVRKHAGAHLWMGAYIGLSGAGNPWNQDFGDYSRSAGPECAYAKGHCIDWGGGIWPDYQYRYQTHCG